MVQPPRFAFCLVFCCLGLVTPRAQEASMSPPVGAPAAPAAASAPRNVILISWDGLDRQVLWELLARQRLPNLAALIRAGSLQDIEVTGHVTVTKPGHAEMLTGLDVKDTGVVSNSEYRPIPAGYSVFERVQAALGGRDRIHTFMVTGKLAHVGGRGPEDVQKSEKNRQRQAGERQDAAALPEGADNTPEAVAGQAPNGEPFYLTKRALDVFDAGQRDATVVGPLCLQYLVQYKDPRFLAFLHFSDPDHAGHRHGAASAEYRQAAVACDEWLGKIVAWLTSEGLDSQTLIYVMTDHGFDMPDGSSHHDAPHSWLATNDRGVTHGGIIADVAATIMAHFGIDTGALQPRLIGQPLTGPAPARPVLAHPVKEKGAKAKVAKAGKKRRLLPRADP